MTTETPTRVDAPLTAPMRGALWLDEMAPGWASQIVLDAFDITDGGCCVCGQTFWDKREWHEKDNDGFDYVKRLIGAELCDFYGFDVKSSAYDPEFDAKWDALQAEWTRIIRDRQEAA